MLIGTLGIKHIYWIGVGGVEGQTALVRPFRGDVDMLPKWPPIRAGPPLRFDLSALLGRPFGGHIDFPPKRPHQRGLPFPNRHPDPIDVLTPNVPISNLRTPNNKRFKGRENFPLFPQFSLNWFHVEGKISLIPLMSQGKIFPREN